MDDDHKKRLKAIEGRANATTGGKWEAQNPYRGARRRTRGRVVRCVEGQNQGICVARNMYKSDAIFTAHSLADISWLIEQLRIAEEMLSDFEEAKEQCTETCGAPRAYKVWEI